MLKLDTRHLAPFDIENIRKKLLTNTLTYGVVACEINYNNSILPDEILSHRIFSTPIIDIKVENLELTKDRFEASYYTLNVNFHGNNLMSQDLSDSNIVFHPDIMICPGKIDFIATLYIEQNTGAKMSNFNHLNVSRNNGSLYVESFNQEYLERLMLQHPEINKLRVEF